MQEIAAGAESSLEVFGTLPDGGIIHRVSIANKQGMRAGVLTLGATLHTLHAPGANGSFDDVVLGHDNLAPYAQTPSFMGAIVGRFANRIGQGKFCLDGNAYDLIANDGPNALHGGKHGFDRAIWRIVNIAPDGVTMAHTSIDGDQGFPGTLETLVTYSLTDGATELVIAVEARTDAPTIVSITGHAFFNLAGAREDNDVLGHQLSIAADQYTPIDAALIPTGELRDLTGSAFDFRAPQLVGARIKNEGDEQLRFGHGYDHNFCLRNDPTAAPKMAARLSHATSGRVMTLLTAAPGLQFYSGNFLDGSLTGKNGVRYRQHAGLCLEPQHFPDAPNKPAFPSARLDPGQVYRQILIYRFSTSSDGRAPS